MVVRPQQLVWLGRAKCELSAVGAGANAFGADKIYERKCIATFYSQLSEPLGRNLTGRFRRFVDSFDNRPVCVSS